MLSVPKGILEAQNCVREIRSEITQPYRLFYSLPHLCWEQTSLPTPFKHKLPQHFWDLHLSGVLQTGNSGNSQNKKKPSKFHAPTFLFSAGNWMEMRWHRFNHSSQMFCFSPLLKTGSILGCSSMKSEFQLFCQEMLAVHWEIQEWQTMRSAALSKTNLGSNWSFLALLGFTCSCQSDIKPSKDTKISTGFHRASHPEQSWTNPHLASWPPASAQTPPASSDSPHWQVAAGRDDTRRDVDVARTPSSINWSAINIFKKLVLSLKCFLLPISHIHPPNSNPLLCPNAQPWMCQASTADAEQIKQIKCAQQSSRASLGFEKAPSPFPVGSEQDSLHTCCRICSS